MDITRRTIYKRIRRILSGSLERLTLRQNRVFYVLILVVGVLTGLSAVAFHKSIDWAEHNFIYRTLELPMAWRITLMITIPALGGVAAGALLYYWAPEARGSGVPQIKASYFMKFGRIRFRTGVAKFILGAFSIGTGGSLGREGPTVQVSASLASCFGRWLGLPPRQVMRLVPLAAAGGIAAAFNTPLAAIMFAIEEIMGDLKHRALSGIVVVAVIAAVIERSVLGHSSLFSVPRHVEFRPVELAVTGIVLGILSGFLSHLWVEGLLRLRRMFLNVRGRFVWALPGVGGLLTGLTGAAAYLLTDHRMGVFGIGYGDLSDALYGTLALKVLIVLCIGKFFATIFSYASGGCGGIFAPTLFIGAMLGGALAHVAGFIPGVSTMQVGALAIVGMGAMFAGIIRAPVTSILIIFELTGDYALILPIMLANLISYALACRLREIPVYEALLLQDGINLRNFPMLRTHSNWQTLPVNTIMTQDVSSLRLSMTLPEAVEEIKGKNFKLYPVTDENGRYVGMVHRKGILNVSQSHPERSLKDILITTGIQLCYPDIPINEAAHLFVESDHTTLPVVSRVNEGKLLGVITLHDITRQQFLQESHAE